MSAREVFVDLEGEVVPGAIAMTEMKYAAAEIRHWTLTYVLRGNVIRDGKTIKEWLHEQWAALEKDARAHLELEHEVVPDERRICETILDLSQKLTSVSAEVVDLKDQGAENDELLNKIREEFGPVFYPLRKMIDEHASEHFEELSAAQADIHDTHNSNVRYVTLLGVVAALLALSICLIVDRLFVRYITERKRAEETLGQLGQSEERYRALFEGSAEGILIADIEMQEFTYANSAMCRMLGYTEAELRRMNVVDIHPQDALEHVISEFQAQARGEKSLAANLPCLRKDGTTVYADISAAKVLIDGRECNVGFFTDITERRKAEEGAREIAEKLHVITNSAQDAIIMMDHQGAITFWNSAAEKIFGYSNSEAIGKDCHSLLMPEEYQELFHEGFNQFKKTGTGAAVGKTLELEAKRKDGERFPIEISVSSIKIQGRWHAVGMVRDITERQQREQAFQREVSRYMAMIDTVPAMVYLKDIDHRYIVANKAFCDTVGKGLDEVMGKTDYDIFPLEKADEYHKSDKIVMAEDRRVIDHEQSIKDVGGEAKWISITRVPVHDSQGPVLGVVGLVQDVTEYRRSREQLIQSDKLAAIGTLAAGVAHEINNPIGFISSNLNTMNKYLKKMNSYIERTGTEEDEDKEAILEILTDFVNAVDESTEGTTRVKNIVANLKSFSRIDRAEKEHANINEGIESTLNIVWNELKYHCKVEKDFGDIPDLYCIPNQLNQVYMNLLLNAGHATKGQSGLINIRTWADDANIYVSVKDNGVGIPEENVKKIFEPFFTTKEVGQGTGLGLSLAFDIIKKHGGNIEVKSEVDVGTEFIVALPCEGVPVG